MRRMLPLAVLLTMAFGAATLPGQDAARPKARDLRPAFDRKPYEIPHRTIVLANGLTLIVHEDHSVPVVGVNLWYHVGSRNEKPGKTGFAHLFEHFFFNGSEHYPHGFREAMDDLGATNRNGTTRHRSDELLRGRAGVGARTDPLSRSRSHGLPGQADQSGHARARAGGGAEREAPGREPALRPRVRHASSSACIRPRTRTAGRPSAAWRI